MRKRVRLGLVLSLLLAAAPADAQIGKRVAIQAGTPEDKALQEISAATDPAAKLALLDKFVTDFAGSDAALAGYEMILAHYQGEKNAAKVYEYADKALAADSNNFNAAFTAMRSAQEGGDRAKLFRYGGLIGEMVARFKASAPPAGTDAAAWAGQKRAALAEVQDNVAFTEYTLFSTGAGLAEPAAKAESLEQFVNAFADSPYSFAAATVAADAYRQARQGPKMVAFAEKVLARDANHYGVLVQLADYWVENKEQYEKAIEYAGKALSILNTAAQPANLTPEQWAQQKNLQMGLAQAAIGQAHALNNRYAEATEPLKASAALLKPFEFYYARSQYLLGFCLSRQKKVPEARAALSEAAATNTPYKQLAQDEISKLGAPAKAAKKRR